MAWFKKLKKKVKKVVKNTVSHIVDDVVSVPAAVIEDVEDEVEHVAKGIVAIATGDRARAAREFQRALDAGKEAATDLFVGALGATVLVAVDLISGAQRLLGIQGEPRRLTTAERNTLQWIFEDSVDLDEIQIVEGKLGLLDGQRWGARPAPYTIGYTIYVPEEFLDKKTGAIPSERLVHETVHIWQFENGGADYVPESLVEQANGKVGTIYPDAGYDFDNALAEGKRWAQFTVEQQAAFMEYAFTYPVDFTVKPVVGPFEVPLGGTNRIDELIDALQSIRGGFGGP